MLHLLSCDPKWFRLVLATGFATCALSGTPAWAQAPVCNGHNVYPCSVGGTLLVLSKPSGYIFNTGGVVTPPVGAGGAMIGDPQNPGFAVTSVVPLQAFGPVLPSLGNFTLSVASVSGQATIAGISASVTCGVTGAANYSFIVGTPGGPVVLNCPHMAAAGAAATVSGQITFSPLSSMAVTLTLTGTAPSASDVLTVGGFSAQAQIPTPGCTYSVTPGGQAFNPAGGSANIFVTTDPGCAWSVSNVPSWVTITTAASGSGNGTVSYQVAPNATADRTAVMIVANNAFNLEQESAPSPGLSFIGSMPHLAAQGGWSTTFTFVNKTIDPVLARPSLFGDDGSPVTLPLTFPQQPPAGPFLGGTVDRTLPANASFILQASGPAAAPALTGSAQLMATGSSGSPSGGPSVDGFAIFHFDPTAQEAVVPLETRNASSYVLPFDNTDSVLLGFAIDNIFSQTVNVPVILRDDTGAQIQTSSIPLNANGHYSNVLSSQFPMTTNLRGTVEFVTPPGGRISALGIRFTPPGTLTTIPALAGGSIRGLVSDIASGNGWETTFVLVNLSAIAQQATLKFFDDSGNPLALPLSSPENASLSGTASSTAPIIAPGASVWINSSGSSTSPLLTGSAQLVASGNVAGFVIFRYDPNGQEAVVPIESRNAAAYVLAFDNTAGIKTGVALSAASPLPVTVPVVFRDANGTQVGATMISLPANGHTSFGLAEQYSETAGIRGTAEFQTQPGAQISVLGIRTPPALTFTTLPPLAK